MFLSMWILLKFINLSEYSTFQSFRMQNWRDH